MRFITPAEVLPSGLIIDRFLIVLAILEKSQTRQITGSGFISLGLAGISETPGDISQCFCSHALTLPFPGSFPIRSEISSVVF